MQRQLKKSEKSEDKDFSVKTKTNKTPFEKMVAIEISSHVAKQLTL